MKKIIVLGALLALLAAGFILCPRTVVSAPEPEVSATSTVKIVTPKLTHQQEVWISALEWCESRGKPTAINPKDRDGTPSYGGFQFKPSTLMYFSEMYGIEPESDAMWDARYDTVPTTSPVMSYEYQRKVVEAMVLDAKHIDWLQQFPDCVRKNGPPPQ